MRLSDLRRSIDAAFDALPDPAALDLSGMYRGATERRRGRPPGPGTSRDGFRRGARGTTHGSLRRFDGKAPHGDRAMAALRHDHPALAEARTIFTSTVTDPARSPRVLVSGHNNPKLGRVVMKGAWRGAPIFHVTLEERATCPRSCAVWRECYGNAMHQARRHRHGAELEEVLSRELHRLGAEHPGGFVVRLHTLGDFYSQAYVLRWFGWLAAIPALRIFGFTAHPRDSMIGGLLSDMNRRWPDRCAIRFSVARPTGRPGEAVTVWRGDAPAPRAIPCPAQTGRTLCCATCALCWSPAAMSRPIAFTGHGRTTSGRSMPDV